MAADEPCPQLQPSLVEVKQPAIYIVSPTATPAEKVTNQGNNGKQL